MTDNERQTTEHLEPRTKNDSRGFTLIELLAVVAIMAMILGIALPAFNAFKLRGTQVAIPSLMSTLRLARQYAITHRQDVYVVFPDNPANHSPVTAYSPAKEVTKALCAYAVIASNRANDRFEYITEWRYLPKGIYFYDGISTNVSVFQSYGTGTATNLTSFPFPADTDSFRNLCAAQFRPNGRAYRVDNSRTWTDFSVTWIPLTSAYVEINTNTGMVTTYSNLLMGVTNVIRIRNKTGQIDIKDDTD